MPEHAARRLLLEVEQAHVAADAPVVAALRLLQHVEMGIQLRCVAPGGAVDAAQHRVAMIAAPIGPGHLHQLERGADIAGAAHVWAAAQIDPVTLAVQRDHLGIRQVADQLGLVSLALGLEERDAFIAVDHAAHERRVPADDLAHLRLDGGKILGGERLVAGEIVVEPVLDRRPDRDLGAGKQRLHCLGQHMGAIVADHLQGIRVAPGHKHDADVVLDDRRQIHQLAVQLHRQRRPRQAGPDRRRHGSARNRRVEIAHGAVGQRDGGHARGLLKRNGPSSMASRQGRRNPPNAHVGQHRLA